MTGIKHESPSFAVAGSFNPDSSSNSIHATSTSGRAAMSAIEHPARMFGRITLCASDGRISADSAIKWTPQNMMFFASDFAANSDNRKESPSKSACMTIWSRW